MHADSDSRLSSTTWLAMSHDLSGVCPLLTSNMQHVVVSQLFTSAVPCCSYPRPNHHARPVGVVVPLPGHHDLGHRQSFSPRREVYLRAFLLPPPQHVRVGQPMPTSMPMIKIPSLRLASSIPLMYSHDSSPPLAIPHRPTSTANATFDSAHSR